MRSVITLILINIFDCVSTIFLIRHGAQEGNPIVQVAINYFGLIGIQIIKIIPLSIIAIIGIYRPERFVKIAIIFTCIVYAVLMILVNLPLIIYVIFAI